MPPIALLLAVADPTALAATAHALTTATTRCAAVDLAGDPADVTVCGPRLADRYRVPLVVHDRGDPRYQTAAADRERLFHRTNPVQDLSPFLVGGGMAGVSVGTRFGSSGGTAFARPLAP